MPWWGGGAEGAKLAQHLAAPRGARTGGIRGPHRAVSCPFRWKTASSSSSQRRGRWEPTATGREDEQDASTWGTGLVLGVAGLCSALQVGKDGRGFGINMYCLSLPNETKGILEQFQI
jgi:hypothetical protein